MQVQWAEPRDERAEPRERRAQPKRRADDDGGSNFGGSNFGQGGAKRRRVEEIRREQTLDSMNM